MAGGSSARIVDELRGATLATSHPRVLAGRVWGRTFAQRAVAGGCGLSDPLMVAAQSASDFTRVTAVFGQAHCTVGNAQERLSLIVNGTLRHVNGRGSFLRGAPRLAPVTPRNRPRPPRGRSSTGLAILARERCRAHPRGATVPRVKRGTASCLAGGMCMTKGPVGNHQCRRGRLRSTWLARRADSRTARRNLSNLSNSRPASGTGARASTTAYDIADIAVPAASVFAKSRSEGWRWMTTAQDTDAGRFPARATTASVTDVVLWDVFVDDTCLTVPVRRPERTPALPADSQDTFED